jgi:hypothetical protein
MAEKRGWSKMGLKERVLNKLALIEAEIERGAYSEEDLLFMERWSCRGKSTRFSGTGTGRGWSWGTTPPAPKTSSTR